eukprot:c37929_g1_i1 orf=209-373(-)
MTENCGILQQFVMFSDEILRHKQHIKSLEHQELGSSNHHIINFSQRQKFHLHLP